MTPAATGLGAEASYGVPGCAARHTTTQHHSSRGAETSFDAPGCGTGAGAAGAAGVGALADRLGAAVFSPCRTWRYVLRREIVPPMAAVCGAAAGECGRGTINFIMLNPSTADEMHDDPTIRRCTGYARSWGYARLVVTNLFAWRTPHPTVLRCVPDPIGPQNDAWLVAQARDARCVVAAWGAHGALFGRETRVRDLLAGIPLVHLGLTRHGQPRHPLFLPTSVEPRLLT